MEKKTALKQEKKIDKMLQEITQRVFDRYNEVEGKEKQDNQLQATIQALHETTGISLQEIQSIAAEVEQEYRAKPAIKTPDIKIRPMNSLIPDSALPNLGVSKRTLEELSERAYKGPREFLNHLIPFIFVNTGLIITNIVTTSFPWAIFPLAGWGIGLVIHFFEGVVWPKRELLNKTQMIENQLHMILLENWKKYRSEQRQEILTGIYRILITEASKSVIEKYISKADPSLLPQTVEMIGLQLEALKQKFIVKKPSFIENIGKGIKRKIVDSL